MQDILKFYGTYSSVKMKYKEVFSDFLPILNTSIFGWRILLRPHLSFISYHWWSWLIGSPIEIKIFTKRAKLEEVISSEWTSTRFYIGAISFQKMVKWTRGNENFSLKFYCFHARAFLSWQPNCCSEFSIQKKKPWRSAKRKTDTKNEYK